MAQFIFGNTIKDHLNKWPFVRNAIWYLEYLVLASLLKLLSWIPLDKASALGRRLGRFIGPRIPKHKSILKNLYLAFPEKSEEDIQKLALEIWANAGAVLTEYPSIKKICESDRLKITVAGYIEGFNRKDRPVILVSAHYSNWEVVGSASTRMIDPVSAPFSPPANPWLARKLYSFRLPMGVHMLERDFSKAALVKSISEGHSLLFLIDQRVDSGRPVPFMGMDKLTTLLPARLSIRNNCELVPLKVERLEGANFHVTFYPPVVPDDENAEELEQALNMTEKVNRHFESWIREKPEEWFCSNRMWDKEQEVKISDKIASG